MSTPNRQIGWSQESNLLSYISKQLDRLNGVVAASSTNLTGNIPNVPEYTDNANAISNGLVVGDVYRTGDNLKIVH